MVPRREAWIAYLLMACQGFLLYGVGYLTPYVQSELGAPAWASALPNSLMAVGLLAAAAVVPVAVRVLGDWGAVRVWALLLAASAMLIAFGASLPTVLLGALVIGVAGAGSLTHSVTAFAGRQNGVLLMRATLASVIGGVIGPLVLSAAVRSVGWNWGILAPVPLALGLAAAATVVGRTTRAAPRPDAGHPEAAGQDDATLAAAAAVLDAPAPPSRDHRGEPPLGSAYWLSWTFLVLCIGAEMSFVAWGAPVAAQQTGISLADATALGSLFVLGQVIGRLVLGLGGGFAVDPRRMLLGMILLGLAGGLLVWLGGAVLLAGAGLLLGGLGLAGVWATTAGVAMANAPRSPVTAGARLNLASGVAIISAPFLLGVAASIAGIFAAWVLVLGLLAVALVVLRLVPFGRGA